jgi:hypothetical protein
VKNGTDEDTSKLTGKNNQYRGFWDFNSLRAEQKKAIHSTVCDEWIAR